MTDPQQGDAIAHMLSSCLREVAASVPDADRGLASVLATVAITPQRRSRWTSWRHSRDVSPTLKPVVPRPPGSIMTTAGSTPARTRHLSATSGLALSAVAGLAVMVLGTGMFTGALKPPTNESAAALADPSIAAATANPVPSTPVPSTTVRSDILPGVALQVEVVDPGVLRLVSDGQRDLTWDPGLDDASRYWPLMAADRAGTVIGRDGSVWNFFAPASSADGCDTSCMTFYRIGSPETYTWTESQARIDPSEVEVAADGEIWAVVLSDGRSSDLRSFDGQEWTIERTPPDGGRMIGVATTAKGTTWAWWEARNGSMRIGAREADSDEWQVYRDYQPDFGKDRTEPVRGDVVESTSDQILFVVQPEDDRLLRFSTLGIFTSSELPAGRAGNVVFGDLGTVWVPAELVPGQRHLAMSEALGQSWEVLPMTEEDGRPLGVAADGALWLEHGFCDGVTRFDGSNRANYLSGNCIASIDFAPDGSVWLQAITDKTALVQQYVITPEAMPAPA